MQDPNDPHPKTPHGNAPASSSTTRFHGDVVVRAAFLSAVLGWGIGFYGPPIFLYAVVSRTGWSLSLASAAITIHFLWGALVVSLLPRLHARFGVAPVTVMGAASLALGIVGWATAQEPWQLWIAAIFSGSGWVTMAAAGINAMISPWFSKRRPAALSTAYNGASVGGMIFSPLWSVLIAHIGFRNATLIVGISMLLIMVLLAMYVLKFTPKMLGQQPDGAELAPTSPTSPTAKATPTDTATKAPAVWQPLPGKTLWRNRRFQTLALAMSLALFAQIGLFSQIYSWLVPQIGVSSAGWAMTLTTACAMGGRSLFVKAMSFIDDRRALACSSYAMQALGSLFLLACDGPGALLWIGLVLFGLGVGNTISLPPLIAQSEFAAVDVSRVVALIVAISQATYAFAPVFFALLLAATHTNASLFAGAALVQCAALIALWMGNANRSQPTKNDAV